MSVADPGDEPVAGRVAEARSRLVEASTPVPHLSEAQIAAFSTFYRDHVERLVTFLRWYGADLAEAADVAQEAMVTAFQHWERVANPAAWVRTVASREFIRRRVRSLEDATGELPEPGPASALLRGGLSEPDPAADERLQVLELLAGLPPRQRQVMAWTYDGFSPAEIALELSTAELTVTPEAVRASLRLARRTLADRIGPGRDLR